MGNVGIGTKTPDAKLTVKGNIHAQEIKVTTDAGADFVFEKDYQLKDLSILEEFVKSNKHLPDIPSEQEMKEKGLEVGEFQIKLLQKIEELTLYIIAQQRQIEELRDKVDKTNQ